MAPLALNASYDHNFLLNNGTVTLHLDTTVKGPHDDASLTQTDLANYSAFVHQGTVALGNGSVSFNPNWHGISATVWVRNLANTQYRTVGDLTDAVYGPGGVVLLPFSSVVNRADGRTFGVQLRDDF